MESCRVIKIIQMTDVFIDIKYFFQGTILRYLLINIFFDRLENFIFLCSIPFQKIVF